MTQRASGWYDDPHDDSQLRYFDGIMWSERTMPKLRPGLEHVGEARPESERPVHVDPPRRDGEPRSYPAHWGPESPQGPHGSNHPYARPYPHPAQSRVGAPGSMGARVGANIIDRILLGIVVSIGLMIFSPDTISLMQDWMQNVVSAAQDGSSATPPMPGPLETALTWMSVATAGTGILYDTVMTSLCKGRTVGRMVFGLAVEPAKNTGEIGGAQRVPMGASLVRSLIKWGPEAFGGPGELVQLVIFLAALGNQQRQGLHDRAARTLVRRTR